MKIFKLIILPLIALVLMSASCEKPVEEPVFTQGFSCKIDGIEWVAKTPASISGPVALLIDFNENIGDLILKATKKDQEQNIYEVTSYKMRTYDGNGEPRVGFADIQNIDVCNTFYHDSLTPGDIEICIFDKTKREISGTFNMDLIAYKCNNEIMKITDGKFAFRY